MTKTSTPLQKKILQAMKAGHELTDMGRAYGIYMGQTKTMQVGQPPAQIKSKVTRGTVKSMVDGGLIRQVKRFRENGNAYLAFEVVSVQTLAAA